MNYQQGVAFMADRAKLGAGQFVVGNLLISHPGYKGGSDYRLTEGGVAPRHTDIVRGIHGTTNSTNFDSVVAFLDDVYRNGLSSTNAEFGQAFKERVFWITLQEEINYPPPRCLGRKLPFQRYYEAALVHKGIISLEAVLARTDNHGGRAPALILLEGLSLPSFYR